MKFSASDYFSFSRWYLQLLLFYFLSFKRLAKNTTGHLNAKQFQDLFDALDQVTRRRIRPPMSYVENSLLRKIQIIVSSRCFDYAGDLMSGVNVLLVSVSVL